MNTTDEAIAYFQKRGYYTSAWWVSGEEGFGVGILKDRRPAQAASVQPGPAEYRAEDIQVVRCAHTVRQVAEIWIVREEEQFNEWQFDSLDDALNVVLARLQAWQAAHPKQ